MPLWVLRTTRSTEIDRVLRPDGALDRDPLSKGDQT